MRQKHDTNDKTEIKQVIGHFYNILQFIVKQKAVQWTAFLNNVVCC